MFPVTDSSSSIISCLLEEARRVGVSLRTGTPVRKVSSLSGGHFDVHIGKRKKDEIEPEHIFTRYLLLATGNDLHGFAMAQSLGHKIVEPRPSLFTFKIPDSSLVALAGVSFSTVRASLILPGLIRKDPSLTQEGPLLITHWGVSGPLVLRLSAWGARYLYVSDYQAKLVLDFIPSVGNEAAFQILMRHKEISLTRKVGGGAPLELQLPRRFWNYLISRLDLDADILWSAVRRSTLQQIVSLVKRLELQISGKGEFKDEFVTAGGVPLKEVDIKTMESKLCPGLFFAGEVVDVDGITGGFNFQNAWTGGFIAGSTVASQGLEKDISEKPQPIAEGRAEQSGFHESG